MSRVRFTPALVATMAGLAVIVAALVWARTDRATPTSFGNPTHAPTAATPSAPTSARAVANAAASTATHSTSATAAHPSAAPSPPAQLTLPTLNVQASVQPVVTTDGVLGVPDDPSDVGWWTGSALPGSAAGTTVIDGHVDSAATGIGALFYIDKLAPGDLVEVTTTAGIVRRYRVYSRQVYVKDNGLPADLFTTTGNPRLVLITCGGPFDHNSHSYLDNIAVFASPIPD